MRKGPIISLVALVASAWAGYKKLSDRYRFGFYYMDKNDDEVDYHNEPLDLRGVPTHLCVCGSQLFYVKAVFDNYEIASYMLDMECAACGSLATAPTPLDIEATE